MDEKAVIVADRRSKVTVKHIHKQTHVPDNGQKKNVYRTPQFGLVPQALTSHIFT
jgi:hypothetical protein